MKGLTHAVRRFATRFACSRRGNVAMMFAVALPILVMVSFGAVDIHQASKVKANLQDALDAAALAREVPKGMEPQVYLMSVMAIDFDSQDEAQYLHKLAQAMGLSPQVINQIHQQVGVQNLYS